jgi:hypothetical protein
MAPIYDLDKLHELKKQQEESVETIEAALKEEQKKLARTELLIEQHEEIMDAHDLSACKRGVEPHDWRIQSRFTDGPNRGKWKTRICFKCHASEALGGDVKPPPVPESWK